MWFRKTGFPKADVRKVQVPYSDRMKKLIRDPENYQRPDISKGITTSVRAKKNFPPNAKGIAMPMKGTHKGGVATNDLDYDGDYVDARGMCVVG